MTKKCIFCFVFDSFHLYMSKERQDPFALVALYKRATVSESIFSITCWHVDNHLSMGKVAMFNKVFWLDLPLKTASV